MTHFFDAKRYLFPTSGNVATSRAHDPNTWGEAAAPGLTIIDEATSVTPEQFTAARNREASYDRG